MSESNLPKDLRRRLRYVTQLEAVGRVAAGVAHDINNVLTIVQSSAALLASDPLTPEQHAELALVVDAAQRGSALTRRLLSLGHGGASDVLLAELAQTLRALIPLVERALGPNINLSLGLEQTPLNVNISSGQFDQLVLNLALNARDAMPEGGALSLSLSSERIGPEHPLAASLSAGDYALLRVADTGVGIDDATRPHIFEPFYTTKSDGRGTGLGLAVVQDIVQELGGAISVESALRQGTVFSVYLPIARVEEAASHARQKAASAAPETDATAAAPTNKLPAGVVAFSGTLPSVLVVEHEDAVRDSLLRLLGEVDVRPLAAKSGLHALQILRQQAVDVLVTEQFLPGMDGIRLLELALQEYPDTVRVLLTARGSPDVVIAAVNKAKVDRVLLKTTHPISLRDEISAAAIESLRRRK